mmetsp:Transcript_42313/g.70478  ORF Transcript_42313/g.70478 Transcript_42313/m.70478 type:complete len:88 (+) Transcript_42313:188-451(+)
MHTYIDRYIQTYIETNIPTYLTTYILTYTHIYIHPHIHTYIQHLPNKVCDTVRYLYPADYSAPYTPFLANKAAPYAASLFLETPTDT